MGKILFSSSASTVAQLRSGFAGETHTFVSHAIRDNVMEIT